MKRTMALLPKFFYAAISISVVLGLVVLGMGKGLFEEGKIYQETGDQHQGISDAYLDVDVVDIDSGSFSQVHKVLSLNANNKDIIASDKLKVNSFNLVALERREVDTSIEAMPIQPADRLISKSEKTELQIWPTGIWDQFISNKGLLSTVRSGRDDQERISASGGEILAGSGFAGTVDHAGQGHQYQSQGEDRHNQIEGSKFIHDVLPANQSPINQNIMVPVTPYTKLRVSPLSNSAGTKIDPREISPAPTDISISAWNWLDVNNGRLGINTNNNFAIEENGSTADNWLSILAPKVYAAETASAKPIPLSLYQPLAGQIMFREALEKLPVEQRTPEKIAELITGISQLLSSLPAKGEIFLADGKFSGLTGTSGILAGKVVKGTYRIKIDPVEGIDLIVPAAVEAGLHGPETVMIGLTPGKGKVKTAAEIGGWKNIFQGLGKKVSRMMGKTAQTEGSQVLGTQVQAETGDGLPTASLTIQLFRDENKNGVYDSGESLVEWAGVKMDLEPTTQSSSYNLTEGWNLIAFPVAPTSVTTAAEAVQDIAKEGGYVTTISTWEGDKWVEYSQRGAEKFGHDFALVPGRAYFLESQLNSVWTVAGTPLPAENQVIQLRKGWNGVGIPKEGVTAVQILDDLQAIGEVSQTSPCEVCETAEQAAKWNFGLWDVVVKRRYSPEHHEVYGRDFPVKTTQGYFLHLNQDTKLKFQ